MVECTGHPDGFELARRLVRPGGTIVQKSTYVNKIVLDVASLVVDEVTVVGSRCGPFEPAIRTLMRGLVDVQSLIDRRYPLENGVQAFKYAVAGRGAQGGPGHGQLPGGRAARSGRAARRARHLTRREPGMSGKLDQTLKGINEAIGQIDDAVRDMGDSVNTAKGQMSHMSLISTEVEEAVGQARQYVFKVTDVLGRRRVAKGIAAGFVALVILANIGRYVMASLRYYLPIPPPEKKKKKRRR